MPQICSSFSLSHLRNGISWSSSQPWQKLSLPSSYPIHPQDLTLLLLRHPSTSVQAIISRLQFTAFSTLGHINSVPYSITEWSFSDIDWIISFPCLKILHWFLTELRIKSSFECGVRGSAWCDLCYFSSLTSAPSHFHKAPLHRLLYFLP